MNVQQNQEAVQVLLVFKDDLISLTASQRVLSEKDSFGFVPAPVYMSWNKNKGRNFQIIAETSNKKDIASLRSADSVKKLRANIMKYAYQSPRRVFPCYWNGLELAYFDKNLKGTLDNFDFCLQYLKDTKWFNEVPRLDESNVEIKVKSEAIRLLKEIGGNFEFHSARSLRLMAGRVCNKGYLQLITPELAQTDYKNLCLDIALLYGALVSGLGLREDHTVTEVSE